MKRLNPENTLLIGIGNNARQDDGLGWLFLDLLGVEGYSGPVLYRYQLQIEDAEAVAGFEHVIFIDAFKESLSGGFVFQQITPDPHFVYTTHQVMPESILYLANKLFDAKPKAFQLLIQGNKWSLKEELTPGAQQNLKHALDFTQLFILKDTLLQKESDPCY
jgi:hydrogenase maturation protease